jgi:hypothetical protein
MYSPKKNKNWSVSSDFSNVTVTQMNAKSSGKLILASFLAFFVVGGLTFGALAFTNQAQNNITANQLSCNVDFNESEIVGGGPPPSLETFANLSITQEGEFTVDAEQGWMKVIGYDLWDGSLPLCITNDWLGNFWVKIQVYGNYDHDETFIILDQKGVQYKIYADLESCAAPEGAPDCCAYDYYLVTFHIDAPICLESSYYPTVDSPFGVYELWDPAHYNQGIPAVGEIPGKEVDLCVHSIWSGCHQIEQYFVVISSVSCEVFKYSITPQFPTTTSQK